MTKKTTLLQRTYTHFCLLRGMDTPQREATMLKLFLSPLSIEIYPKYILRHEVFLFRMHSLFKRVLMYNRAGRQSRMLSSFVKMTRDLSSVSTKTTVWAEGSWERGRGWVASFLVTIRNKRVQMSVMRLQFYICSSIALTYQDQTKDVIIVLVSHL